MEKNILALDIATICGFAVSNELYGEWDFRVKRDESSGMRLIRFESKLKEIIELREIDLVVYERPAGRHASSVITASELMGVMKRICERKYIPYRAYSATEIKKFATGKGNSGKPLMIQAANEKYGLSIKSDNIADAIHLLNMAFEDYKSVDLRQQRIQHKKTTKIQRLKEGI